MVSERAKICRCGTNAGKLINDVSDLRLHVKSMEFGKLNNIEISNLKRDLALMRNRVQSLSDTCNLDTTHQEDVADNISRQLSFIVKKTDVYDFDIEKNMMLHNLGVIRDQIIKKLDDCSID